MSLYRWEALMPEAQSAYNHVAATLTTPPIPEGWPEGIRHDGVYPAGHRGWICRIFADGGEAQLAAVYGATREEAEHLACLTAWTIANQMPVAGAAIEPVYTAAQEIRGLHVKLKEAVERGYNLSKSIDGLGGYREQVKTLTDRVEAFRDQTEELRREQVAVMRRDIEAGAQAARNGAAVNLSTHLTPSVLRALRPGLLTLLAEAGEVSPEQVDEALDDAGKMAALLLRVKAVVPF